MDRWKIEITPTPEHVPSPSFANDPTTGKTVLTPVGRIRLQAAQKRKIEEIRSELNGKLHRFDAELADLDTRAGQLCYPEGYAPE